MTAPLTPLFQQEQPLFSCPKCEQGTVKYRFEFTPNSDGYADWSECDNFLCGEQFEVKFIEDLPLVLIKEEV